MWICGQKNNCQDIEPSPDQKDSDPSGIIGFPTCGEFKFSTRIILQLFLLLKDNFAAAILIGLHGLCSVKKIRWVFQIYSWRNISIDYA